MTLPTPGCRPVRRSLFLSEDEDDIDQHVPKYPTVEIKFQPPDSDRISFRSLSSSSPSTSNSNDGTFFGNASGSLDSELSGIITPDGETLKIQQAEHSNGSDSEGQNSFKLRPKIILKIKLPPKDVKTEPQPPRFEQNELYEEKIGLKFRKADIFLKSMGEWYEQLGAVRKARLTKTVLRRKAINEAFLLNMPVSSVPKDWIQTLETNHGLKVYKRFKNYSHLKDVPKKLKLDLSSTPTPNSSVEFNETGDAFTEARFTSCGRKVKAPKLFVARDPIVPKRKRNESSPEQSNSGSSCSPDKGTEDSGVSTTSTSYSGRNLKKIVDLTNEPPPAWWTEESKRTGYPQPRELTVYTNNEKTILFYDYDCIKNKSSSSMTPSKPALSQNGQ